MSSAVFSGDAAMMAGMVFAALAGFFGWQAHQERTRARCMRERVRGPEGLSRFEVGKRDALIVRMEHLSNLIAHGQVQRWCPVRFASSAWFEGHACVAGVAGRISEQAFCEMRFRMAVSFGVVGLACGLCISGMLGALLAVAGAVMGWRLPAASLKHRQEERVCRMEAHLPEMLDVLALGMGSGLSFDSAVKLYSAHFKVEASKDLERAQIAWESGLESRDDALRRYAASYDSPVLGRVTETWIRSLRFGTSMVEGLMAEGEQARAAYKAKREERIAKAPVKMMVPTGTLILPAMLILVLGPVLLELMNGGF